jgi:hypothetical protein
LSAWFAAVGSASAQEKLSEFVEGTGVVIAVGPGSPQLELDHEEIKGFLHATRMKYPVARDSPERREGRRHYPISDPPPEREH